MLHPYIASEHNPHMHLAGESWKGEKLYDFRFYELEIVSYALPLAVYRWDTYARNDSFHRHCDFYELVLVYRGSAQNDNGSGKLKTLTVGNVFLMPPGSIHRYQAINEFAHFNILFRPELLNQLRFDLEDIPGFQTLFRGFGLAGEPSAVSPYLFLSENDMAKVMQMLEECCCELGELKAGYQAAAVASFLRALTTICRQAQSSGGRGAEYSFRISRVVEQLNSHYVEWFDVPRMAKLAGMSVSNFRHRFPEVMGVSPVEFLTRLRLKMAAQLLTTPEIITNIASQVGFEDGNYFARQFRKYTQLTPTEFRNAFNNGKISLPELEARLTIIPDAK
jgi:AraC-like DNA-binding protein